MAENNDAEHRGRTVLAERVIEKIAAQVASEQPAIGGTSSRAMGLGKRDDLDARPAVSVELTGRIAALSVQVGVDYPTSVRQATEDLRRALRTRVQELTGVEVRQVDLTVTYLQSRTERGRRVLA